MFGLACLGGYTAAHPEKPHSHKIICISICDKNTILIFFFEGLKKATVRENLNNPYPLRQGMENKPKQDI